VVHLASHIPANQEDAESADQCFRTNALGTLKLLQASEEAGISHFLQTTSANAYAPGLQSPREDDPMYPSARAPFYLSSKLVQDAWGAYWSIRRGLPVTTLRLSSVYGAGMEAALFTRFAKALHKGDCITIANGGIFGADFVEISDVSAAVTLFLGNGATGPFNIASGERTTLAEAARLLSELSGRGAAGLIVESEHQAEAGFPAMDISKARRLGFSPTGLRAGLEKLVAWVARDGGEASA
jgi:UDP-glucose 4-epimerase